MMVCDPSVRAVESSVLVYVLGEDVDVISLPILCVVSHQNVTPATALLSVAVAVRVTDVP